MKIITKDLYEASYLMSQGMHLHDVFGDRRTVLFQFEGDEDLKVLKNKYEQGRAQANVKKLKKQMTYIKDVMFARIRTNGIKPFNNGENGDVRINKIKEGERI